MIIKTKQHQDEYNTVVSNYEEEKNNNIYMK